MSRRRRFECRAQFYDDHRVPVDRAFACFGAEGFGAEVAPLRADLTIFRIGAIALRVASLGEQVCSLWDLASLLNGVRRAQKF